MKLIKFLERNSKILMLLFVIITLPSIYLFVYKTGGIKYVYSHTMYIPILLAGIVIGSPFGMLTALVGGILLGPLMPIDVAANEPQELVNWIYRLLVFLSIGSLSDYFSGKFKRGIEVNRSLISVNQDTHVPNINSLELIPNDTKAYTVATVIISDRNNINEVFGYEVFNKVINHTYFNLLSSLPQGSHIIQSDSHILWLIIPFKALQADLQIIIKALDKAIIIDDINIFVEYYIGAGKTTSIKECKNYTVFRETDRYARFAEKNNLPYAIYDENQALKQYQVNLLSEFKNALETNQTYLTYHPVIDLADMSIYKFEALIRWSHPEKGLIMPNDFIPLVENTQLVHPLVDWVVNTGLVKLHEFNEKKIETKIAFNVSGKNFNDVNLFDKLIKFLKDNDIHTNQVSLEITETVLMENPETSKIVIKRFKDAGVTIAIDDFGKGYSSFAYLSQFAIDYVKIDRYFINKIKDESIFEIVKATINLAHQLNFKVIAEGVETLEILNTIKELRCDYAQGFYFGKPVHQDEVIDYYLRNKDNMQEEKI